MRSNSKAERQFARDLVRRGRTFAIYKVDGVDCFAPSRFIGYVGNTMEKHLVNEEKDGRDTNPIISEILKQKKPFSNEKTESKFINYFNQLREQHPNNKRSFWRLKDGTKPINFSSDKL